MFLQSLQLSEVAGLEAWRLHPKTEPNSPPKAQAEAEPKSKGDVRYTYTDESSMLATGTFCPTDHALGGQADVAGELKDASVTGRVFASFPVLLKEDQRIKGLRAPRVQLRPPAMQPWRKCSPMCALLQPRRAPRLKSGSSEQELPWSYARGRPLRRSYARGRPLRRSYARGRPLRRGYARGRPLRRSYARGRPLRRSYARGRPLRRSFARGRLLRRSYARGRPMHLTHQRWAVVYTIALVRPATHEIEASSVRLYRANLVVSLPENGVTDLFIADAFLWLLGTLPSMLRLSGETVGERSSDCPWARCSG